MGRTLITILLMCSATSAADAALTLSATTNVNPARPSEILYLELTITNTSAFARSGVVLELVFPADLNSLFESQFDGDCPSTSCDVGEVVTWTLGTLAGGGSVTVNLPAQVSAGALDGAVIVFSPVVIDDSLAFDTATLNVEVQVDTIYDLTLSEDSDPATAGDSLTYKLTFGYRNDAVAANDSSLRLSIPANTTFVSATGGGALNAGNVEWSLGVLNPGNQGIREVTVLLDDGLSAGHVIAASAEVFAVATPTDGSRAQANTTIAATAGLQLTIETLAAPARPGELANYRLTVTNSDPFSRFAVVLTGTYPQDLHQLFESEFGGDCTGTTCGAGERVHWFIGDISSLESVSVDLPPIIVDATTAGVLISFFATAVDSSGLQTRQMDTIGVQDDTFYDLAIADSGDPVPAGSEMTYRLTYGYRADAGQVNNSILRLPIPMGAMFVSATAGGALVSGAVEWSLGFLSPGDGNIVEATVMLGSGLAHGAVIEAAAAVFAVNSPDHAAHAEVNTIVRTFAGLALDLDAITFTAAADRHLNVQLTVTNNDATTHSGVQLQARFPQSLVELFENEPGFLGDCGGTSCTAGELISWPLVNISSGQSVTFLLPPTVVSDAIDGDLISFLATVTDDQGVEARGEVSLYTGCLGAFDIDCDGNPDTDGDGIGDGLDTDLINPSNNCTGGTEDDATLEVVVTTLLTCAALQTISVNPPTEVEAAGHLRLISPTIVFQSGFRAGQLTVVSANPCPFCSS